MMKRRWGKEDRLFSGLCRNFWCRQQGLAKMLGELLPVGPYELESTIDKNDRFLHQIVLRTDERSPEKVEGHFIRNHKVSFPCTSL
jgi:hypothetical protein